MDRDKTASQGALIRAPVRTTDGRLAKAPGHRAMVEVA
jgi:hypothetical protein